MRRWLLALTIALGLAVLTAHAQEYYRGAGGTPFFSSGGVASGQTLFANGTAAAPGAAFAANTNVGFNLGADLLGGEIFANSSRIAGWYPNSALGFYIDSAMPLSWRSGAANPDVLLYRDAAAVLALRNGTTAQTFRVYGNATGAKYLILTHDGTNPTIDSSSGALKLGTTAVTPATTGTRFLCISTAGVVTSSASACSGT
ncbi:MAG TPA: hypothetical protein VKR23_15945 [Gaiellaceae bacterium]|nr:hypothetical protein [Gaiellaceae bacterium]